MSPATPPPLDEALDHPLYEMEMLDRTWRLFGLTSDLIARNALLESFVVHARALCEFFGKNTNRSDKPERDNWFASDFVRPWTVPTMDVELINRMNREVCHVGRTRQRPEKRTEFWNFQQVIRMLAPSVLLFVRAVQKRPDLTSFSNNAERITAIGAQFFWTETERFAFPVIGPAMPQVATSAAPSVIIAPPVTGAFTSAPADGLVWLRSASPTDQASR